MSETERGQRWLSNFLPKDEGTAVSLLDRITVVNREKMFTEIKEKIKEIMEEGMVPNPVLPIPARSGDFLKEKHPVRVLFEDYSPDHPISPTPGSEGTIGNLVRDLCEIHGKIFIDPEKVSNLDDIRLAEERRIRSIIIVTDYIGSGEEIEKNIASIVKNKTIRSWMSYRLVKIYIVCYAVSSSALNFLQYESPSIAQIFYVQKVRSIKDEDEIWTPHLRKSVEDLCTSEIYINRRGRERKDLLGFKNSGILFVPSNRVPNNIPFILRMERGKPQGRSGAEWYPLFKGRVFPDDLQVEMGFRDSGKRPRMDKKTRNIKDSKIYDTLKNVDGRPGVRKMILMLRELTFDSSASLEKNISTHIRLDEQDMKDVIIFLKEMRLIKNSNVPTRRGLRELSRSKNPLLEKFDESFDLYYPDSMR
ncbi:phosphoribosyltransferase-like protein [Corynebacterium durum]